CMPGQAANGAESHSFNLSEQNCWNRSAAACGHPTKAKRASQPHLHVVGISAERRRQPTERNLGRRPEIEDRVDLVLHSKGPPLIARNGYEVPPLAHDAIALESVI